MQRRHSDRNKMFKRAEQYVQEYRQTEKDGIRLKRQAKATGNFYVPPEAKVALVVRIRGINKMHPDSKKILQLLRLRQINNAVFIKINKASLNMLARVEPYVAWGYPSLKTVKQLVYKRGFMKVNKQRVPITDNAVIEKALGTKNIICTEDLVHELFTCGPNFKEANNAVWPFKLSSPLGGMTKKRLHFVEGGEAGNREAEINRFVAKMI
jgi:large subunit ribosomal protein L7e